jgi:hypothetical protein
MRESQVILPNQLDWDIKACPVISNGIVANGYKAIHRDDDQSLISIVKDSYREVNNKEFKEIVQSLADISGFSLEGYSSVKNGSKVLAYLKNNQKKAIAGFEVDNYMILGNTFDRTSGFFVGNVNKMLRCTNQWGIITMDHSIRHNSKIKDEIDKLAEVYQIYFTAEKEATERYESWHGILIPEELKELFVERALDVEGQISARKTNQKLALFDSVNREIAEMGPTAFALFNGMTHYTTHKVGSVNKVFGNVFGHTKALNDKAEKVVADLIEEYSLV